MGFLLQIPIMRREGGNPPTNLHPELGNDSWSMLYRRGDILPATVHPARIGRHPGAPTPGGRPQRERPGGGGHRTMMTEYHAIPRDFEEQGPVLPSRAAGSEVPFVRREPLRREAGRMARQMRKRPARQYPPGRGRDATSLKNKVSCKEHAIGRQRTRQGEIGEHPPVARNRHAGAVGDRAKLSVSTFPVRCRALSCRPFPPARVTSARYLPVRGSGPDCTTNRLEHGISIFHESRSRAFNRGSARNADGKDNLAADTVDSLSPPLANGARSRPSISSTTGSASQSTRAT